MNCAACHKEIGVGTLCYQCENASLRDQIKELRREVVEDLIEYESGIKAKQAALETMSADLNNALRENANMELQNGEYRRALELLRDMTHDLGILETIGRALCEHEYTDYQCEKCGKEQVTDKRKDEFEDRTLCYKILDKGLRCTLPSGHAGGCGFVLVK